ALAQAGHSPALHALAARYFRWMKDRLRWLARGTGLSRVDLEDAQQGSYEVLLQAVGAFRLCQVGWDRPCHFRTFLRLKLRNYLRNICKQRRRQERHFDRSAEVSSLLTAVPSRPSSPARQTGLPNRDDGDPAATAEYWDLISHLWAKVRRLGARSQYVVEQWSDGAALTLIAHELGQPYHRVKRQWQVTLAQLREWLQGL